MIDAEMLAVFGITMTPATRSSIKQKLRVSSPVPWISKRQTGGCAGRCISRRANCGITCSHPCRPIDIVRAEDQDALEIFAAEIDRHHLADQLAGAVGIRGFSKSAQQRHGSAVGCGGV